MRVTKKTVDRLHSVLDEWTATFDDILENGSDRFRDSDKGCAMEEARNSLERAREAVGELMDEM